MQSMSTNRHSLLANKPMSMREGGTKRYNNNNNSTSIYKFKTVRCHPKGNDTKNKLSCYTRHNLLMLADLWNKRHPDQPPIKTKNPTVIWKHLKTVFGDSCDTEMCWLNQLSLHPSHRAFKKLMNAFAPLAPSSWNNNPNEWLSSVDIANVMQQYEEKYKCFDFIGPSPLDGMLKLANKQCVFPELCNFNIDSYKKEGIWKIGIIFNTDKHDEPGSHWVSVFINIRKKRAFYYDSAGDPAPDEIKTWIHKCVCSPPHNFKYDENAPIVHQHTTTECGMYALYFIVHMLEDKLSAQYLKTHNIKDEYIAKFRAVYFNKLA